MLKYLIYIRSYFKLYSKPSICSPLHTYTTNKSVSIKDTGTGIDQEILPKLFTKFATKFITEWGMGLGLFISKSIIERHGERIWAVNNAAINGDGKRSTFAFSLSLSNLYKIIVLFRRRKIIILF